MRRLLSAVTFGVILCAMFAPAAARAGQWTLRPGRVYTFTNVDDNIVAYLRVGAARVDYVSLDADGAVADFGVGTGLVAVKAGGETLVSANAASAVTYDAELLSVDEAEGAALLREPAVSGETRSVRNAADEDRLIMLDNNGRGGTAEYDAAVYDGRGAAVFTRQKARYTSLRIPASGRADLTARSDGLTLMVPAIQAGTLFFSAPEPAALTAAEFAVGQAYEMTAEVRVTLFAAEDRDVTLDFARADRRGVYTEYRHEAALNELSLAPGETLTFTPRPGNGLQAGETARFLLPGQTAETLTVTEAAGDTLAAVPVLPAEPVSLANRTGLPVTFRADPNAETVWLDYTLHGEAGVEAVTDGEPFAEVTVPDGQTWTFSADAAFTLRFPAAWLTDGLTVDGSAAPALTEHRLRPGESLLLTNAHAQDARAVLFAPSALLQAVRYDYALSAPADTRQSFDAAETSLSLPAGGQLAITARTDISLRVPADGTVSVREAESPALERHRVAAGASLRITNRSAARAFAPTPVLTDPNEAEPGQSVDYILTDARGEIAAFGQAAPGQPLELAAGHTLRLTNTVGAAMDLVAPYFEQAAGLSVSGSDKAVLQRLTLAPDKPLDILNLSGDYDLRVRVADAADPARAGAVPLDFYVRAQAGINAYGASADGYLSVPADGEARLMAALEPLLLSFPSEWLGESLAASEAPDAPLYRHTLKPGEWLALRNRDASAVSVQNSSQEGAGRYFLRASDQPLRPAADELPAEGPVTVAAREETRVLAAPGADLELWMPAEWAKRLIR